MPWPLVHLERTCFALHHVPVAFQAMVSEGDKLVHWFAHYAVTSTSSTATAAPVVYQSRAHQYASCTALSIERIDGVAVTYKALSRFAHDFGIVPYLLKEPELFGYLFCLIMLHINPALNFKPHQ